MLSAKETNDEESNVKQEMRFLGRIKKHKM